MLRLPYSSRPHIPIKLKNNEKVCNIRPILFLRIFFGHYSDFNFPSVIKWVLKIYCIVMPLIVFGLFASYFNHNEFKYSVLSIVEFVAYYSISLSYRDLFLLEYFSVTHVTDNKEKYMKYFRKVQGIIMVYVASITIYQSYNILFLYKRSGLLGGIPITELFTAYFCRIYFDFAKVPVILIFSLLYTRVKILHEEVICEIDHPRRALNRRYNYVSMYDTIRNSFEKTYYPTKYLVTRSLYYFAFYWKSIILLSLFIKIVIGIAMFFTNTVYPILGSVVSKKYMAFEENRYFVVGSCIVIMYNFVVVYYPALILELVKEDLNQIEIYIVNQLSTFSDERRAAMTELKRYMTLQPLECRVWRILRVDGSLLINAFIHSINLLILLLQFSNMSIGYDNRSHMNSSIAG